MASAAQPHDSGLQARSAGAKVLMVCTANICRSPVAAALWQARVPTHPADSAGVEALPGLPPDPLCVDLMAERGIDLTGHRARRFHARLAHVYDLIFVMEARHRERICTLVPALRGRVHLLGRWTDQAIADPHRRPRPYYQQCVISIEAAVEAWRARL